MLKNWTVRIVVPLASAAVLIGCNRTDVHKGTATAEVAPKGADARPVSLTGCLSTGTGTNQYMLTQVRFAPLGEQPSDAMSYTGTGITEHSQVRLAMADDDQLTDLVGQMVTVAGAVKDDGRNTIGTSGPAAGPSDPERREDQSKAATQQHHSEKVAQEAGPIGTRSMNNGTFPEITVQRVNGTGEKCQTIPVENRR